MILKKLGKLDALLREAGYVPDGSFVMHDVDEEEKVHSLPDHGEKLAVAYGLLKVPEGMPICAKKNLRVCGDLTIGNCKHLISGRMFDAKIKMAAFLRLFQRFWCQKMSNILTGAYVPFSPEEQKKLKEKQFQKLSTLNIEVTDVDALLHPSNLRAISTPPGFVPVEERWNVCAYFLIFSVFGT
ncbi:hypothetical protein OIU78_021404 [Salix suchowensis]|nr:hypothetical protein OIU78_021404 [Salix suchowensis]